MHLTWNDLVSREPRLSDLRRRVEEVTDDGSGESFCANYFWYGAARKEGFKGEMSRLVGHGIGDDPGRSFGCVLGRREAERVGMCRGAPLRRLPGGIDYALDRQAVACLLSLDWVTCSKLWPTLREGQFWTS